MAKKATAKKTEKKATKPQAKPEAKAPKVNTAEMAELRRTADEAKAVFEKSRNEAAALREKAKGIEAEAKAAFAEAVAPYREACRKAGVTCPYSGHRATNVSERVSFLVEKVDKGLKVAIEGRPETAEVIPTAALEASINKAAYAYTDKHVGPREEVGNKGGSLSNRLRAALTSK